MNVAYLKVTCRLRFNFLFSSPDCWCLFTGIVVHQLWSSIYFSRKQEVWAPVTGVSHFFFLSNWDGALHKLRTLHISIVHIAQTGPGLQGHFQRGRCLIFSGCCFLYPQKCSLSWQQSGLGLKFGFVYFCQCLWSHILVHYFQHVCTIYGKTFDFCNK